MAKVIICDRCGEEIEGMAEILTFAPAYEIEIQSYELCSECGYGLCCYMNEHKEKDLTAVQSKVKS